MPLRGFAVYVAGGIRSLKLFTPMVAYDSEPHRRKSRIRDIKHVIANRTSCLTLSSLIAARLFLGELQEDLARGLREYVLVVQPMQRCLSYNRCSTRGAIAPSISSARCPERTR